MPSFSLTKKALADVIKIGRYTQERWGVEQRNLYLAMLDNCFQQLSANPLKGRDCGEIRSGFRKMNAGSHVIFYRQKGSHAIEIVRVLHGCMDLEARIPSDQN